MVSECSKLAQEETKTRHDWVGKVIHCELCKIFQFDHMSKWYMHNPTSVLENETHKLFWDFDIQTDHIISVRRPDLKKERTCKIADFAVPADHRVKSKESEKKDKYIDRTRELKKNVERESDVYTNYNWCFWNSHQRINKGNGGLGEKRTIRVHPNYYNTEIGQNTEKSPGDLRRLAVTQTPVKGHLLKLI